MREEMIGDIAGTIFCGYLRLCFKNAIRESGPLNDVSQSLYRTTPLKLTVRQARKARLSSGAAWGYAILSGYAT